MGQLPKKVKLDMSIPWPPEGKHATVVVVVGLVVEIIDSQVPNGSAKLRPEHQFIEETNYQALKNIQFDDLERFVTDILVGTL